MQNKHILSPNNKGDLYVFYHDKINIINTSKK